MTESSIAIRKRLLGLVGTFPGLHLRELARLAGQSEALASYHLDALVDSGHVASETDAGYRRFYALRGAPTDEERVLMPLLRQAVPLQIVVFLLDQPGATHQALKDATGLAKSTVSYHLGKLQEARIVAPAPAGVGFVVLEPRRVERVLLRWEPPADVTDRFTAMWRSFYAARRSRKRGGPPTGASSDR